MDKDSQKRVLHNDIERRRRHKYDDLFVKLQEVVKKITNTTEEPSKAETLKFVQNLLREEEANQLTSELKFNKLIHQVYNEFVILINCETGSIIYVTENIQNVLHFKSSELTGKNIFQFIHTTDFRNFQNQLTIEIDDNSSLIHHATGLLNYKSNSSSHLNSLKSQRAFMCKMKNKNNDTFSTVHITGHIQSQTERLPSNKITKSNYFLATVQLLELDLTTSKKSVTHSETPKTQQYAIIDKFIRKNTVPVDEIPPQDDLHNFRFIFEHGNGETNTNSNFQIHIEQNQRQPSIEDDADETQNISFHELLNPDWN